MVASLCAVAPDPSPAVSLVLVDSRVISSFNAALAAKEQVIAAKEQVIAAKDVLIAAKDELIAAKKQAIAAKDERNRAMASFMSRV